MADEYEEEREYADSAMWKIIQQNTFTRWTNEHLKSTKLSINNMEKDFSDGLKLISLIEVLSGKKFTRYNKKPSFRTQKFENVTMSLKFLEEKEGIKLVNIDSSDIVDQKLKLIMGLIWTLILHYSITMPMWDDENSPFGKDATPKQRLLAWIQNKIPEKNITNFTSDWNDGTAIAALVDALGPGLCPDWATLDPKNKVPNAKDAMDKAEKWMDIPQVIKPEEMCNPNVDELSMMTYLSRFPSAKLKSGAPVQQKPNAHRIKAYGPGIELNGNVQGSPARFIVETANAGTGELEVVVEKPKGGTEKVECLPNNDRTLSYNCVYTPSEDGQYKVTVKWGGQPSTKQPYLVNVVAKDKAGDPAKVTAQGPGVEKSGVLVNRKTYFEVFTKGAGVGVVDVGVVDPNNKPIKSVITKKSDDVWYVEYTAETPGLHSVNINFAGKPIPKSPYPVGVGGEGGPPVDASRLPGKPVVCSPRDAAANSIATPLKAQPGSTAPVPDQDAPAQKRPSLMGKPEEAPAGKPGDPPAVPGKPSVPGKPGEKPDAPGTSPAAKQPVDAKRCWASGKGIQPKGNRLGEHPIFSIHTENAGPSEPRVMVMGPGGMTIQNTLKKVKENLFECQYKPVKSGLHIINVTFGGQSIPKSPFKVDIGPTKTSKVVAFGPGLETGVVNEPCKFTVQPNGEGPIGFKIEGPSQAKIEVTKNPQQTEMYVTYYPTVAGEYGVRILSNNDDIPKSPYMVDILPKGQQPTHKPSEAQPTSVAPDASKVVAYGPGLEKEGNMVGKWAEFTVDATKTGKGDLKIKAVDTETKTVDVIITDNKNLTFSCKYLPAKVTRYTITITYSEKQVPKSPFLVNIKDGGPGLSKVKVYGPAIEKPVQAKILTYFIIDCKEAGPGEPQVTLKNDKGLAVPFVKKDLKDKTYRVEFTAPLAGKYQTNVTFLNKPAPNSPYTITVLGAPDASKVKVYGPALEKPVKVSEVTYFIVDCKEAGPGEPRVVLMGEKGVIVATKIVDQTDRTFKVEFTATVAGVYNANVQFASSPVPKSPFKITVEADVDASKVYVKDLPEFVPVNKEVTFEVVTAGAGPGKVKVLIKSPTNKLVPLKMNEKPNQSTFVTFTPVEPGPHKVEVSFAEKPVAKSPFTVTAEAANPFKVKVYGPAVEKPVFVNEITFFIVDCKEAGSGVPQIKLLDDKNQPVPFNLLDQKDRTFRVEFTPLQPGSNSAHITFANQTVPKSPYKITIELKGDASKVKVYGPAVEKPVTPRQTTHFIIDCKEAGPGTPKVFLTEEGTDAPVPFILHDNKDGTFKAEFTPQKIVPLNAKIDFKEQPVPKSPFKITVAGSPSGFPAHKVKVYGPAVESQVSPCQPTYFVVDCKEAGPGQPQVRLVDEKTKTPVPFLLNDNKDQTFNTSFTPQTVNPLLAEVTFQGQPVPDSPFKITVAGGPDDGANKVKVYGPAVEQPVQPHQPTNFTVDCKEAGPGTPTVKLTDDVTKASVPCDLQDNKDGTFKANLKPETLNPITAKVTFKDQPVPKSPFKITVAGGTSGSPAEKVKVYGPAVENSVTPRQPTHFVVDCKEAGTGQPHVVLSDDQNKAPVPFTIEDNKDKTFKILFSPEKPTTAEVKFANQPVPKSPFKIRVGEDNKVKVYGPAVEAPVEPKQPTYFIVDCKEAGPGAPYVELVDEATSTPVPFNLEDNKDKTFKVSLKPETFNPITAKVGFAGQFIPKSPFKIRVGSGKSDPNKVKVYGPAIEEPVKSNFPTYFTVDTKEAGSSKPVISLVTEDTKEPVRFYLVDKKDGTINAEFTPTQPKNLLAQVKMEDQPVPRSPFQVKVEPGPHVDPNKVKLFGPATEGPVKSGLPTNFVVDTKEAGPGKPDVVVSTEDGSPIEVKVTELKEKEFTAEFVPVGEKSLVAKVKFGGSHVPKSPLNIPVTPGNPDASKVKLEGPAVEGPVKNKEPTYFVVNAKEAGPGKPEVKLTADDGKPVFFKLSDNNDGTHVVDLTPQAEVPITVEVKFAGQPVPKSPFKIQVNPGPTQSPDASKAKLYGPALEGPVKSDEPTFFVVDIKEAGPGRPKVELNKEQTHVPVKPVIHDQKDKTFKVEFVPTGTESIIGKVTFNDTPVPKSPFKIPVKKESPASKVKLFGPAFEGPVKSDQPTFFVVDAKVAGPGKPTVKLSPERGSPLIEPKITDNNDGTHKVDFTPKGSEPIKGEVWFENEPVPNTPFRINVLPQGDHPSNKVKVFGPAVEEPVKHKEPTFFIVDTKEAGPGKVGVEVKDDSGKDLQPQVQDNNDGTYKVSMTPEQSATAKVSFNDQPVPKSPFKISMKDQDLSQTLQPISGSDPKKVQVYGPAVEAPILTNQSSFFFVDTTQSGPGPVEVEFTCEGGVTLTPQIINNGDDTYTAQLNEIKNTGLVKAQVKFNGQEVPKSPFHIDVVDHGTPIDPTKVKLHGPAFDGTAIAPNAPTHFLVDFKESGPVKPKVKLDSDSGKPVEAKMTEEEPGVMKIEFTPNEEPLTAKVTLGGANVPHSPFSVVPSKDAPASFTFQPISEPPSQMTTPQQTLGPHPSEKVKVFGPAVEQPVKASEPTFFVVDTHEAGQGQPVVSVTNPQGIPLPVQKTDNRNGTYKIDFTPNQVGVIFSNVSFAGKPVPGSPFKTTIEPKSQPARVADFPKTLPIGKPTPINIQTTGPKKGPATVQLINPRGGAQSAQVFDKPDGFVAQVIAQEPGPHKLDVRVANEPAEGSPFFVEAVPEMIPSNVIDPSKVRIYGPGLKGGTVNRSCDFTIDTSSAGPGNLGLTIDGPTEAKIECFDKGNGIFDVKYLPNEPGEYTINVTFDEKPIPNSPFKAQVNPEILVDVRGVKTYGPGIQPTGVFLDSVTEFTVDTKSVQPKGLGHLKAILTNPSGTLTEAIVKKNDDDTYTCLYTPFEQGPTKIDVTYDGLKVPGSPFSTNVQPGCDPSRVKVYGSGIEKGEPNQPQKFTINTRGAGLGGVGLSVVGPTEPHVDCVDNQDGTLSVEYFPDSPGEYEIGVTFADQPVPGSPFIVPIGSKPAQEQPQSLTQQQQPFSQTTPVSQQPGQHPQQQFSQPQQHNIFPEKVKCFGPGLNPQGVKQGQKAVFSVVPNQAGEAPVRVEVTQPQTGQRVPVNVKKQPSGTYDVEYVPQQEGPVKVEVFYGEKPVPGSPFHTVSKPGIDLNKVIVSGDGVRPQTPASIPVAFIVDTRQAAPQPLPVDVEIKNPQGKQMKPKLNQMAPGVTQAVYVPEDAGPYQIAVKVNNQEIPNSPLRVAAVPTGNSENVVVPENLPPVVNPGQLCQFKVNKPTTTGMGNVTCKVTKVGKPGEPAQEIPTNVQDNHDGTVTISYPVPQEEGVIVTEVKFGGVLVPRGRITQKVGRPGEHAPLPHLNTNISTGSQQGYPSPATSQFTATGPFSPQSPTTPSSPFKLVEVPSIPVGPNLNEISAIVVKPSGQSEPVQVIPAGEGNVKVVFQPTEPGPHILKVLYAGKPVPGDPFSFFVHTVKPGQVVAYGPGLVSGEVNQPCVFTVVTKNAGPGGLALAIEGPSKADIKCRDNKDGSATITYTPTTPGEYKIVVKHGGQPISGAPFIAKITGKDRSFFSIQTTTEQSSVTRQSHVTMGSTRHLTIQVTEQDLSNLTAVIRSPSGQEEPCGLKRQPNGQLGISFTPKESGEHSVTVFRNGSPIPGSPFRIFIQTTEVGDAARVKVYGRNIQTASANEINEFIINTKEAGVAGLSISVQGPGKVEIKCTENDDGTTKVTFKPSEPGVYNVTIKYGDKPVPGSPFTINVDGIPSGRVKERIVRQQQAASITSVGTTCELNITMPGININEVEGSVTSPSGQVEKCEVVDLGNNRFKISFSPKESGVHYVSLKHKGIHIPGSPFQFTVGPIVGGGPEKVRAVGPGLERGQANKPCHFTVITREAGAGSLSLGVEGPSKAIIDFQDRRDGTSDVNYLCSEPGEYLVSVKFNGQHIPDSPFKVYISSSEHDNKFNVQNLQQHGLPINTQTQFLVEFTGIQGNLEAKVVAPSGLETAANVHEVSPGRFSVNFVPRESGVHYVHLLLNGSHVPGSPYPVQVGLVTADPTKVKAYGEGLQRGHSGQPCKFIVNTTESGPGALSVGISGPSKVELNTREVEEGYEFTYTPMAPGPYLITIKYAGNTHIPGSPFKAQIEGLGTPAAFIEQSKVVVETVTKTTSSHQSSFHSDASKVFVTGNGLNQLFVNQDANFVIDGSQAGYNILWVGIAGPHIPVERILVNHLGNLRYSVNYQVSQPGNYQLFIKWGDQLIPGCPYNIVAH